MPGQRCALGIPAWQRWECLRAGRADQSHALMTRTDNHQTVLLL